MLNGKCDWESHKRFHWRSSPVTKKYQVRTPQSATTRDPKVTPKQPWGKILSDVKRHLPQKLLPVKRPPIKKVTNTFKLKINSVYKQQVSKNRLNKITHKK